jgi:predicted DNA-binding protein (UPF0251 family)
MARPQKTRQICFLPEIKLFKPVGGDAREEVVLSFEELEAIRLKDYLGLEQEECAEKMEISRPTFQRILVGARQKLASALVEGRAIRFEGGTYQVRGHGRCRRCGPGGRRGMPRCTEREEGL